jgi:SAM-dependent methyltransferase
MPLDRVFHERPDGIEPEELLPFIPRLKRLLPPFLPLVSLPSWLGARRNAGKLDSLFRLLEKQLAAVAPTTGRKLNYSAAHFAEKQNFVRDVLAGFAPARVLDIGCNTGHFSVLAAQAGAEVVAIDPDPAVVGALWRRSLFEDLAILPLVVNLSLSARPASFLNRARGGFDAVLMLALIHHLLATEGIPLDSIFDLAAEFVSQSTTGIALVEYIAPEDAMFRGLDGGREEFRRHLTRDSFETSARRRFDIVRTQHGDGAHRRLYLLRRKR